MLQTLHLRFGSSPGTAPLAVPLTPVTVFVGPNNSGKTRLLHELSEFLSNGRDDRRWLLLNTIDFCPLSRSDAETLIAKETVPYPAGVVTRRPDHVRLRSGGGGTHEVDYRTYLEGLQKPNDNKSIPCSWYLAHNMVRLDGPNRISLVNQTALGDLQNAGENALQRLFRNDSLRAAVREKIHDAFGEYFVLDPTNVGSIRVKLSKVAPPSAEVERGIDAKAVAFHGQANDIQRYSDGVKAYTGILATVMAGDPQVVLIDEPEAFLHPALAFRLGSDIASSVGTGKHVFVSTHSPEFLMGCIQSGAAVNVVRLTYRDGASTARLLPNSQLLRLMRSPLLRSTGVLAGLFYESVVVTEADTDRAFYQEINERLVRFNRHASVPNALFLNAQNWQTVSHIVQPLRELGIATAAIVDVDVLKSGADFPKLLFSAALPELHRSSAGQLRSSVYQAAEATALDWKRNGGIAVLDAPAREAADNLFDQLAEYGVFVVRGGELESWLTSLAATGHGPSWLVTIFAKMGEDPDQSTYVQPGQGDVWAFMENVARWLKSPKRKGIPA